MIKVNKIKCGNRDCANTLTPKTKDHKYCCTKCNIDELKVIRREENDSLLKTNDYNKMNDWYKETLGKELPRIIKLEVNK